MLNIEKEIVNRYITDKMSALKIAKEYSKNVKTIWKILRANNVKARTISQARMQYTCNDDFFSVIDTEEKAYWLGVLYADGNISKKASKSGQIFLTSVDLEWVTEFMKAVDSSNKPRSETHKKFNKIIYKAQITSAKMYNDLNSLGCTPVKTHTIRLPLINDDLLHHFIRGYFDGDGTVGTYQNLKSSDWKILKSGFCSGSKNFIEDLLKVLPVKNKTIRYSSVYITQFSLNDSIALHNYMYKEATIYLKRKKDKFTEYLNSYIPRKRFNDYNRPS
jgi:hypothetical protein